MGLFQNISIGVVSEKSYTAGVQILIYLFKIDARSYECLNAIACNDRTLLLKPAELLEIGSVLQDKIPVVKRFTGGGTVIVDTRQFSSPSYATRMVSLVYNHILGPSCHGAANCIAKCFKELEISLFMKMARDHLDFICRMKDYISLLEFINRTISALGSQFSVTSLELESFDCPDDAKFVPSSRLLGKQELEESFGV
ncbi:uncharacterized protein LOC132601281 [Lycium barbarum]|uniref:uncharacterized protein LOC132601281 n=1 Tax=Lycium barbarum TaxID=112863 RepID=UPI00293E3631|nr:uncharacterized protein LOC132601281 [Lycium barbarum]